MNGLLRGGLVVLGMRSRSDRGWSGFAQSGQGIVMKVFRPVTCKLCGREVHPTTIVKQISQSCVNFRRRRVAYALECVVNDPRVLEVIVRE